MVNVADRKLYGKRELTSELECANFREAMDYRLKKYPETPLFTTTDYSTGERTVIMPREFKDQYQAVSTWLFENGYRGKRIALMGDNSFQYVLALYSVLCSHNMAVPLDKSLEKDVLSEYLRESGCSMLFYSKNYEEKALGLQAESGIEIRRMDDIQELAEEGQKLLAEGKTACLEQEIDNDAPAVILFTSGTTGKGKGVVLSQKNIVSNAIMDVRDVQFVFDGVLLLPFHHAYGITCSCMNYILCGNTVHINQNMRYMFRDLQTENPEGLVCVPLHVEVLYNALWKHIRDLGREEEIRKKIEENRRNGNLTDGEKREMFRDVLGILGSRLRVFAAGGAPVMPELYYGFKDFGIVPLQGYGITECSPLISCNPADDVRVESVGQLLRGMEIMVDQPNENREGEICVKGPNVMLGYYGRGEETAEAMKDGWFHTGDLGYLDKDDFIYLTGRKKNLIILANGENVSPEELEAKIVVCPAVKEVVVYEKDGKIAAQILADEAYAADGEEPGAEESIRRFISELNRSTTNFKQISVVEFRRTPFARNSSQKILRTSVE